MLCVNVSVVVIATVKLHLQTVAYWISDLDIRQSCVNTLALVVLTVTLTMCLNRVTNIVTNRTNVRNSFNQVQASLKICPRSVSAGRLH
jgi:hypothetical protein